MGRIFERLPASHKVFASSSPSLLPSLPPPLSLSLSLFRRLSSSVELVREELCQSPKGHGGLAKLVSGPKEPNTRYTIAFIFPLLSFPPPLCVRRGDPARFSFCFSCEALSFTLNRIRNILPFTLANFPPYFSFLFFSSVWLHFNFA